jgi:PKD repeat protein
MTADPRHRALGLAVALVAMIAIATLASAAPARAAGPAVDARVVSTFVMAGRITTAVRVRGEHPGQLITRHWQFSGQGCTASVCRRLTLRRERADHRFSRIVLARVGVGRYAGRSRFFAALRCRGRRYSRGEEVPYRITVQVTQAAPVEGVQFAARLAATYTNARRLDRTRCPLGPSHDAAVYTGTAAPLPSPPVAAFTAAVDPATDDGRFTDTSTAGAGGAPIVARQWQFGDPASGSADTATTRVATHQFSGPGAYTVTLTVRDANGLSASSAQTVIAAGPPLASFSAAPAGAPLAVAFRDTSTPGPGGAPVVGWYWVFGDPASGSTDVSGLQNPQHTFTAPGTYRVCLIIRDANGRTGGTCQPVAVAASGSQSVKRTVASTAES